MSVNVCMSAMITKGFPKIRSTLLGGPYNKDYSLLGSILGSPYFGKLPQTQQGLRRSTEHVTEVEMKPSSRTVTMSGNVQGFH